MLWIVQAQAKRDAVRQSWMHRARSIRQNIVVKFFLAQPAQGTSFKDAVKMLEVRAVLPSCYAALMLTDGRACKLACRHGNKH